MNEVCTSISEYFCRKGIIDSGDKNAFRFALELIVTQIVTLISILLIGILMHNEVETVLYCVFFVWARKVFDGYHAKTFLCCYLLTITFFITILLLTELNINYIYLNFLSLILINIYMKNHKDDNRKVVGYLMFYSISVCGLYFFDLGRLTNICSLLLFAVLMVSKMGGDKHGDSSC